MADDHDPLGAVVGTELIYDSEDIANPTRVLKTDGSVLRGAPQPRETLRNVGVYLQTHWHTLGDRLRLTGGLRLDHHSITGPR